MDDLNLILKNPANPILCYETRSGVIENIHRGVFCSVCVSDDGSSVILDQSGNINQRFYLRSGLKFVQAIPLIESGAAEHYDLTEEEIAVVCASHDSQPFHLEAVRSILSKIEMSEADLQCGGHTPCSELSAFQYVREGADFPFTSSIYNNCSGKHAGFLALCKFLGHPTTNYLDPDHPVQILVREAVCDVFALGVNDFHVGVDGCSAPTYCMSVRHAALGFARMSKLKSSFNEIRQFSIQKIISAISNHPHMVWGTAGFDTALMLHYKGKVIGKRGAAGVYVSGIVGEGIGCAVKIDDGTEGPQYTVAINFLALQLHFTPDSVVQEKLDDSEANIPQELLYYLKTPSINCKGVHVGDLQCHPDLFQLLKSRRAFDCLKSSARV